MAKDSFVFYRSFYEAIQEVPVKYRAVIYEAVFEYVFEGREPSLSGVPNALWILIKPQLDANQIRYENGIKGAEHGKKGAEYGKLGGRPRKEKNPPKTPQRGDMENPPNVNVNVNENVNDNVNVNVNAPDGDETNTQHTPPTLNEITIYCARHNISTDLEKFWQYNNGKGWPMDWVAALALWVQKDKEKKQEAPDKNRFNNFKQREYDFEELEKQLLSAQWGT